METTVTISLKEYETLKNTQIAFDKIKSGDSVIIFRENLSTWHKPYYKDFYINTGDQEGLEGLNTLEKKLTEIDEIACSAWDIKKSGIFNNKVSWDKISNVLLDIRRKCNIYKRK